MYIWWYTVSLQCFEIHCVCFSNIVALYKSICFTNRLQAHHPNIAVVSYAFNVMCISQSNLKIRSCDLQAHGTFGSKPKFPVVLHELCNYWSWLCWNITQRDGATKYKHMRTFNIRIAVISSETLPTILNNVLSPKCIRADSVRYKDICTHRL